MKAGLTFGVAVLAVALAPGLFAEVLWKQSDALGNDRGPAPKAKAGAGWALRVETDKNTEQRTLFHDGKEDSLRLLDRDAAGRMLRSRELRGGVPTWEVTYDPVTALPVTETAFEDGVATEIATLTFEGRLLTARTVRTPDGGLRFTDQLRHWPDGTLRRLERDGPNGPLAEASWSYGPGGTLTGAWAADEDEKPRGEHREWTYSPGKTEERLASETAVLISRVTETLELGATRETKTEDAAERKEVRTSDAKGRITEEVITVKGKVSQTRRWTYDEQGRVLEMAAESAGPLEVWIYLYGGDGSTTASLTRDGQIVREEVSVDGEKQFVRLYDRGALFLEETWNGGKRTKETYYLNGKVVRERTP